MQNFHLQRKQTWFKVLPSLKIDEVGGIDEKVRQIERDGDHKKSEKLKAAIEEVKAGCDNEDEELKIDLDFLMGDDDDLNPMDEETGRIGKLKSTMSWNGITSA